MINYLYCSTFTNKNKYLGLIVMVDLNDNNTLTDLKDHYES